MKKVKMIVSAAIIFAVVGSALAFKARNNPDLYTCIQGTCQPAAYSDFAAGPEISNPGNLFKPTNGFACVLATDPCKKYTGRVWINE